MANSRKAITKIENRLCPRSTREHNADIQIDAFQLAGCKRLYQDMASSAKSIRPELVTLLAQLRAVDTVVIWNLDRLGRSLKHLAELVDKLASCQIGLKSLNDPVDTNHAL